VELRVASFSIGYGEMVNMYGDDLFLAFSVADSDEENVISPPPTKEIAQSPQARASDPRG
jgi:hypothetical protein